MKGDFLIKPSQGSIIEANIYADKAALILDWLLMEGIEKESFSLREVAKEVEVSLGLVQRTFNILAMKGLLQVEGIRTAKRFIFKKSKELMTNWLENYNVLKKCKIRTYRSAISGRVEILQALKHSGLLQRTALALHSAAESYGYKNTNLETVELYLLDPSIRTKVENVLRLEPQERGYEVLLIEPYYKAWIQQNTKDGKHLGVSPILLAFLDLYHFPLRGQEQAEFIAKRAPELRRIYKTVRREWWKLKKTKSSRTF